MHYDCAGICNFLGNGQEVLAFGTNTGTVEMVVKRLTSNHWRTFE